MKEQKTVTKQQVALVCLKGKPKYLELKTIWIMFHQRNSTKGSLEMDLYLLKN